MTISDDLLVSAIDLIAHIPGIEMDPEALVDDIATIAYVWPEEHDFKTSVASVHQAMTQLINGQVQGTKLKHELEDWMSFHFQQSKLQGEKATMRIIYQLIQNGIRVRGFGHRYVPHDIYQRLHDSREQ